jgi:predicted alpha/beta superfamily hydrolase
MKFSTMRKFFFLAFLFCCGKALSQDCKDRLVVGHIDSLHSNILNEERKLWISIPDHQPGDGKKFPVIYMPDAEMFFIASQAMVQVLKDQMPDAIVVGIVNTDRNRDLLPTHVAADTRMGQDSAALKNSGGAEKFEQFIEKEVIPYVESKYPTQPYRILSGHSYGGLFTVYTFVHHNGTFNAWIVSDPSLWWDHQVELKESREFLKTHPLNNETLFLGFANSAQSALGLDTNWVKHDTSARSFHMRSIFELRDALQQNAQKDGLRWDYKYYPAEVHGSVYPLVQFDALKFMFDYYLLAKLTKL